MVWEEQHALHTQFLTRPARKELIVPQIKSSDKLIVLNINSILQSFSMPSVLSKCLLSLRVLNTYTNHININLEITIYDRGNNSVLDLN